VEALTKPIFLIPLISLLGYALGEVRLGNFKLGVSATLFVGMGFGWYLNSRILGPEAVLIDRAYFDFLLMLFMVSTGLLASRDVARVFRGEGKKLLALTLVTVGAGALSVVAFFLLIPSLDLEGLAGVFTGAITSSPGLAIALEAAGRVVSPTAVAAVGLGYALTYPFSVVIVVLSMGLLPRLFSLPVAAPETESRRKVQPRQGDENVEELKGLDMAAFAFTAVVGYLLGQVAFPLGTLGNISLQTPGGMLVAGLLLGNLRRIGPLNFAMSQVSLSSIQQIPVVFIFSYVGLTYGYDAVQALSGPAVLLVLVGVLCTLFTVMAGFLVGRFLLKLDWVILSGAICGSMTSTPGLGAALESTGSSLTAGAYGSTYPIGLLAKVLVVLLLYTWI
jgi:putative transport protein